MNEYRPQLANEIAALETRAAQLHATSEDSGRRLAALAAESEAARSAEDAVATQRIGRKIHLEAQRAERIAGELGTLLELIAARRARYGLQPSRAPLTGPSERPRRLPGD